VATTSKPIYRITRDERKSFWRDGFLILPQPAVSPESLAGMRRAFDLLVERCGVMESWEEESGGGKVTRSRVLLDSQHLERELGETPFHCVAERIAGQLFDGPVTMTRAGGYYKPPRVGSSTLWHQDAAFFEPEYPEFIILWMPLQPVSVRSGCLAFVPGTHRMGLLPHYPHVRPNHPSLAIRCGLFDPRPARSYPLPAGGLAIYSSATIHGSGPNLTRIKRRAFILDYERSGTEMNLPTDLKARARYPSNFS
jgi:ectoine hydroxylase-related dioxygenase (phytanoyl-CoA dioxygenase family)